MNENENTTTQNLWDTVNSVKFSRAVVSDSLRPHESQHVRPPCPLPTPSEWTGWISLQSKRLSP